MNVIPYRNDIEQGHESGGRSPVSRDGVAVVQPMVRIVGCGRWSMGDDQAGLVAADLLRRRSLPNTAICLSEQPVLELTDERIGDAGLLIVIDAALADEGHSAGTIRRFEYNDGSRLRVDSVSIDTHSLGVSAALQLAGHLGLLPKQVWIYVVFGSDFDRELSMSGVVEHAIPSLVELIEHDVTEWMGLLPCMSSP